MIQRRNVTITEMRKTVLSECQGLSVRGSPLPKRLVLQILQPPFLQGVAASLLLGCAVDGIDVATFVLGAVNFISPSSVVSPAA